MSLEKAKILVVEDHGDTVELLQMQLKQIGYPDVLVATDGIDALHRALQDKPRVILMDISLPRMNGFEAAQKLKADPRTCAIPILAVTAKAMPGDREKCLESGCDGYLAKPISRQELKDEIEKLLA
jgi:CheY-like chemotaxis protein